MRIVQSCSWCGELADVSPTSSPICFHCGHRPDLPKYRCDCRPCSARARLYEPREVEAVEADLFGTMFRRPNRPNGAA